jgi:succinoglycan biosynthesis protein ExoA
MVTDTIPLVSIVMPALNEERYISAAIASIIPKTDEVRYELLVVDGGSTDDTPRIVEAFAAENPRIKLIANAKRIQAAAVNIAARAADPRSRYFVRADCHLRYPEGFVERCIAALRAKQVASVVVPMQTEGTTCFQKAVAVAQNSRLGNGGSAHRLPGWSGFVDHGHHAAFDRQIFLDLGGYDETFTHNEDAEFDRRLIRAGERIYLDGQAAVTYYPRSRLGPLARQYFSYGWGRASTLLKHRVLPKVRHVLPVLALAGCIASAGLAILHPGFLAFPVAYVVACVAWGCYLAVQQRELCAALSGPAAIVMHMSWGVGFLARLIRHRPGGSR